MVSFELDWYKWIQESAVECFVYSFRNHRVGQFQAEGHVLDFFDDWELPTELGI